MSRTDTRTALATAGVVLGTLVATFALASSGGGGSRSSGDTESRPAKDRDQAEAVYQRGVELAKEGRYEDARKRFEKAHEIRKEDPEILNMLAFTMRKTGDLGAAFETYEKALSLRPKFPQAREYLGEAHIQAALQQVEVLRGYGPEGEEHLAELVAALRAAAETLEAEPPSTKAASGEKAW